MLIRCTITYIIVFIFLWKKFQTTQAKTWIQAGYWFSGSEFPVAGINSPLFTHLFCAFAYVNGSNYEVSVDASDQQSFSTFTETVRQRNPKVTTLLSIGGGLADPKIFSQMASSPSNRNSFTNSTIKSARLYGFHGLDLMWVPETVTDMTNLGTLIRKWRTAVDSEAENTGQRKLILTVAVEINPIVFSAPYPVLTMENNLDWVNLMAYEYHLPRHENRTGASAALFDPTGDSNTDNGLNKWINMGISAEKLVLGFPYHGYAWKLANAGEGYIGADAMGPDVTEDGSMRFRDVRNFMKRNGVSKSMYNDSYVVNYATVGSTWINFDDVEAVKAKVSYAKEKKLLGYYAWQVSSDDDNWVLSKAAYQEVNVNGNQQPKRQIRIMVLSIGVTVVIIASVAIYYIRKRMLRYKADQESESRSRNLMSSGGSSDHTNNRSSPKVFRYSDIVAATNGFSFENKLGEGGFGPVYKGTLLNGTVIAAKKSSKSSKQGFEEFKNEVSLTANLQHVNLVRVLGFCIHGQEQILIYEYMPNKSLDFYIFDATQRVLLDWKKRVHIIEGVIQGLLYLQEYSGFTVIHRDLKASNILLDNKMNAKISDFGMAKIFSKDKTEENTDRIVGTFGFAPPEYVRDGVYSTKSDVYSFGILLLQIISGKKNAYLYGPDENLHLLDYAYELWKEGREVEFVDSILNDNLSSCKLNTCLQIGLLCVQENAKDRPSMLEISSMLKNETMVVSRPNQPAFSRRRNQEVQPESFSVNTCTLSHSRLHGRR